LERDQSRAVVVSPSCLAGAHWTKSADAGFRERSKTTHRSDVPARPQEIAELIGGLFLASPRRTLRSPAP
jgi:hypothetical protein